jgi:hypothetical protein
MDEKGLLRDLAAIPQVKRGMVWCHTCGRVESVSAANFKTGWPGLHARAGSGRERGPGHGDAGKRRNDCSEAEQERNQP